MLELKVRKPFRVKTASGQLLIFRPGERFTPPDQERRKELIRRGLAEPVQSPRPCLMPKGDLVIPFDSDPCYWWWAGGQSIKETLRELNAPPEVMERYGTA